MLLIQRIVLEPFVFLSGLNFLSNKTFSCIITVRLCMLLTCESFISSLSAVAVILVQNTIFELFVSGAFCFQSHRACIVNNGNATDKMVSDAMDMYACFISLLFLSQENGWCMNNNFE